MMMAATFQKKLREENELLKLVKNNTKRIRIVYNMLSNFTNNANMEARRIFIEQ
jgi:hypothetical protein